MAAPEQVRRSARDSAAGVAGPRRFRVILIKPSHYDDDGYVIRWYRSPMPANSLASVYGLVSESASRKVLGPDVELDITAIDETNTRVRHRPHHRARCRRNGKFGFVGAGRRAVQSVSARARYRAAASAAGVPVVIGGFHVSGLLAMFPTI